MTTLPDKLDAIYLNNLNGKTLFANLSFSLVVSRIAEAHPSPSLVGRW